MEKNRARCRTLRVIASLDLCSYARDFIHSQRVSRRNYSERRLRIAKPAKCRSEKRQRYRPDSAVRKAYRPKHSVHPRGTDTIRSTRERWSHHSRWHDSKGTAGQDVFLLHVCAEQEPSRRVFLCWHACGEGQILAEGH